MSIIHSDFPTIQDEDGHTVCRACGRRPPHRYEQVGYHNGAVRCIAAPLEGHDPGIAFVRGKVRSTVDASEWDEEWVREVQVDGALVEYIGGWLFERADGVSLLWDDVHPDTRAVAREARKAYMGMPINRTTWTRVGYLADRTPTGQASSKLVWRDGDAWGYTGERPGSWITVSDDEPIYASASIAGRAARQRWNCT